MEIWSGYYMDLWCEYINDYKSCKLTDELDDNICVISFCHEFGKEEYFINVMIGFFESTEELENIFIEIGMEERQGDFRFYINKLPSPKERKDILNKFVELFKELGYVVHE